MKNKLKLSIFLFAGLLGLTTILPSCALPRDVMEPDNVTYDVNNAVQLTDIIATTHEGEEEEEEIGPVKTIKLHYVNEDNACLGRAFYIWVDGVDGVEYSNEVNGQDIVEYAADGSSMAITINVDKDNPDPRFKEFVGRTSIKYIIKYKMISPSKLNWGGQSEDVELRFEEFNPDANGEVVVWSTPAAGGGIAQFKTEAETKVDGIKLARFSDWKTIHCTATDNSTHVMWSLYAFDENYYRIKIKKRDAIKKNYLVLTGQNDVANNKEFDIDFKYTAKVNVVYCLVSSDVMGAGGLEKTVFVTFEQLYDTPRFTQLYSYLDGNDLGFTYTEKFTTFKVWAPTAANMNLLLYEKDTSSAYGGDDTILATTHMNYISKGIWTITVLGDLNGIYYNYQVDNTSGTLVTMDPYATACGSCGVRAMVYDKNQTNPDGWDELPVRWDGQEGLDIATPQDLSIYEVHIQDFTGDESWVSSKAQNPTLRGTYNAFVESGTKYTSDGVTVSTGYDHLDELGIKAVQLLPVFDSDNDENRDPDTGDIPKYNWGYNPLNYNCVEGVYSSDPHDGTVRIKEFKNLVLQMSRTEAKTRVIMDVVYNHVSSPSGSCFNKLMPRYAFRYDENGELHDGSGCHNEVKSDAPMMSKYIIDSVCMWATEYKIKGFRFDLMGLIDYATLNTLKARLTEIDPDIYIYGEGWTSGGYHGSWYNTGSASTYEVYKWCNNFDEVTGEDDPNSVYLGCFNDTGRNAVKGANDQWGSEEVYPQKGFMQKTEGLEEDANSVADMIWGIHRGKSNQAKQTINYVSCHDNWTLRDQLYQTLNDDKPANGYDLVHASIVSNALVFASNAAAFMLGGEELMRTKEIPMSMIDDVLPNTYTELYGHKISHNSYNSPIEVNSFKWGNKIKVTVDSTTVYNSTEHYVEAYAGMIKLHNQMPKFAPHNMREAWPTGTTTAGNTYINLYWTGSYGGALGIQFDEYFIYVAGRNQCGIPGDSAIYANRLWDYGTQSEYGGTINMGGNGYGLAIRVCKR